MKTQKIQKYIFIVSIAIAIIFFVLTIGKKIESPFNTSIKPMDVISILRCDDDTSIVLCGYGKRLSFLNKDKKVIKNIYFDETSPITTITKVVKYKDDYYLYGSKKEKDLAIITNDRVVKYNQNFTNYEIVFDELREFKSWNERISDIVIEDDKLYVCENYYLTEKQDYESYIYCVDLITKEKELIHEIEDSLVYKVKYFPKNDNIYLLSYLENFKIYGDNTYQYTNFLKEHSISRFIIVDENNIIWHDLNNKYVYYNDKRLIGNVYTIGESINDNKIICLSQDGDTLTYYDISTNNIEEYEAFDYSLRLITLIWIKWLSIIYKVNL